MAGHTRTRGFRVACDIGASRDRRLRQWVFGSTPDRLVRTAGDADVPVLAYARPLGVPERLEDYLFPVYRYRRRPVPL